jgi:hypothetical protein
MSNYFAGSKWSNDYGKMIMPVLVPFAEKGRRTTYKELAARVGNPKSAHPRMHALGRISGLMCYNYSV